MTADTNNKPGVLVCGLGADFTAGVRAILKDDEIDYISFNSFNEAAEALVSVEPAVIVATNELTSESAEGAFGGGLEFLQYARKKRPKARRILMVFDAELEYLKDAINRAGIFRFFLKPHHPMDLLQAVRLAVEAHRIENLNRQLTRDIYKQNRELRSQQQELNRRILDRKQFLTEASNALALTARRLEKINSLTPVVHSVNTIVEIEEMIPALVDGLVDLEGARITLPEGGSDVDQWEPPEKIRDRIVLSVPIYHRGEQTGNIHFFRSGKNDFSQQEKSFLIQLSETVSAAVVRIRMITSYEETKQEWEETFDSIKTPVALVSAENEVIRANKSYAELVGKEITDISGDLCHEIFAGREQPCESCTLREVVRSGEASRFELGPILFPTGDERYFRVLSSPSLEKIGHVVQYYRDITAEKELQQGLIESDRMAELGLISGSIAHEINNPLGGILAFIQIMMGEVPATDPMHADLLEMEKAAQRCKAIVQNLLGFSRHSRSEKRSNVQVESVVDAAVHLVSLQAKHSGIEIRISEKAGGAEIFGNINELSQVMVGILNCSIDSINEKISQSGEYPGCIELGWKLTGEQCVITVSDNGIGVSLDEKGKILTPYFTTKGIRRPGVGLSATFRIIRAHGGKVEVSKISDGGTRIYLQFPIADVKIQ